MLLDDKKPSLISITDYPTFKREPWNDKCVVRDFAAIYDNADLIVTWYGIRFDNRFLNTRLLYHGLPPLSKVPQWDGWRVAKYNLKMSSNRLDTVTKFFNLGRKTPLDGQVWVKARGGHRQSLKYIDEHCVADVLALRDAYLKLRPLSERHPHVGLMADRPDGCPYCGSGRMKSMGWRTTSTRRYRRFRCIDCAGIIVSRTSEKDKITKYRPS